MKKIRMKYGELRALIETLVREADVPAFQPSDQTKRENASVDHQIDDYLTEYEQEAQLAKNEGFDLGLLTRRFLNEAGEDDEDPGAEVDTPETDPAEEPAAAAPPPAPAAAPAAGPDTSVQPAMSPEPKLSIETIDMENFCGSVHRLIENAQTLLEMQNVIYRRAFNYILEHYEPGVTEMFQNVMRDEYGIDDEASAEDIEATDFAAPDAVGAGPDIPNAGGGGSGGA